MSPSSVDAVARYFERRYPARASWLSGTIVRRGERELSGLLRSWLPSKDGFDLLDVGCGDGTLLSQILLARPRRLRLEDLIPANVSAATALLRGRAHEIEGVIGDAGTLVDPSTYDVVLATGVLDYYPRWQQLLRTLVARSRGTLIFDVPRGGCFHHQLRRIWLATQGISLQVPTGDELATVLHGLGSWRMAVTKFSVAIRLDINGAAG